MSKLMHIICVYLMACALAPVPPAYGANGAPPPMQTEPAESRDSVDEIGPDATPESAETPPPEPAEELRVGPEPASDTAPPPEIVEMGPAEDGLPPGRGLPPEPLEAEPGEEREPGSSDRPNVAPQPAEGQRGPARSGPQVTASPRSPGGSRTRASELPEDGKLRFNFRDAPVDTVLDYLSEAAGFIIVCETTVEGNINMVSHQPLNREDAVKLLNTVLNERGYAAIHDDRTLTIVKREEASKRNIPVRTGNIPEEIPKTAEMVTQIIPVRYADATQLLENLTPLLPSHAVANANKSSNAIVLTDTQANVRRMAEIIRALDTSISTISEIRVFALTYSKAADVAKLINSIFQVPTSGSQAQQGGDPLRQFFARMRGGDRGGAQTQPDSAAMRAASRVVAVSDDRTNAVVVSAPGDLMPLIETVIEEIDTVSVPATEIRVFPLTYADAEEMAQLINDTFKPPTTTTSGNELRAQRFFGGGPFGRGFPGGQNATGAQQATANDTVNAVADYRTNSVVVSAETNLMEQIARMIEQLDSDPAREQKVFIYKLKNANPEEVANIMQGMFAQQTGTTTRQRQGNTQSTTTRRNTNTQNTTGTGTRSTGTRSSGQSRFSQ